MEKAKERERERESERVREDKLLSVFDFLVFFASCSWHYGHLSYDLFSNLAVCICVCVRLLLFVLVLLLCCCILFVFYPVLFCCYFFFLSFFDAPATHLQAASVLIFPLSELILYPVYTHTHAHLFSFTYSYSRNFFPFVRSFVCLHVCSNCTKAFFGLLELLLFLLYFFFFFCFIMCVVSGLLLLFLVFL